MLLVRNRRSTVLSMILLLSLAINLACIYQIVARNTATRAAFSVQVSGVVQHLNRLSTLLTTNGSDWNDPSYKVEVYESITAAIAYARGGHGLVQATDGREADVAAQLGTLAWVLDVERASDAGFEGYIVPAQRIVEASTPVPPADQSALETLGRNLRSAGWPLTPADGDPDVAAVQRALQQFLAQEGRR